MPIQLLLVALLNNNPDRLTEPQHDTPNVNSQTELKPNSFFLNIVIEPDQPYHNPLSY